jgi:hypothetical protein
MMQDHLNNIYVLGRYHLTVPGGEETRINLIKYDPDGNVLWTFVYDSSANGFPRGFDMALDSAGNCYIGGGSTDSLVEQILFIKVNNSGSLVWEMDSLSTFSSGRIMKVIHKNNAFYLQGNSGVAVLEMNGTERWSVPLNPYTIAVDELGQMIVSEFLSVSDNILRFDSNGVLNFSDSTILAQRIATDIDNNIYLLNDYPMYELVKYDNAGNFEWLFNSFPPAPPFGDIGFDILTDLNNDIILVGLNDTMYKFNPAGNIIWKKTMNGMDQYLIKAKISYTNFLAIAGSITDTGGNDAVAALFDLNGNQSWVGIYNSNNFQEYAVDIIVDFSGIFLLEDSMQNIDLIKFTSPFFNSIPDFSLVCIDSVWYGPVNPQFINVRVFNGNIPHINYPVVRIVSPAGDTISNQSSALSFFTHPSNDFQTYTDSIYVTGITDFSNYTFLFSDGIADTIGVVDFCLINGLEEYFENDVLIYPNPVIDRFTISANHVRDMISIEIYDVNGKKVLNERAYELEITIDLSGKASGIYFMRLSNDGNVKSYKIIKQ